jgi:hypothetical protein
METGRDHLTHYIFITSFRPFQGDRVSGRRAMLTRQVQSGAIKEVARHSTYTNIDPAIECICNAVFSLLMGKVKGLTSAWLHDRLQLNHGGRLSRGRAIGKANIGCSG